MDFPRRTAVLTGYNQVHNGFSSPEAHSLPGGDSVGSGHWRTPQIPLGGSDHRPPKPLSRSLFYILCLPRDKAWCTAPAWTSIAHCPWAALMPQWRASQALASHCWGMRTSPQLPVSYPSLFPAERKEQSSRLVHVRSIELSRPSLQEKPKKQSLGVVWNTRKVIIFVNFLWWFSEASFLVIFDWDQSHKTGTNAQKQNFFRFATFLSTVSCKSLTTLHLTLGKDELLLLERYSSWRWCPKAHKIQFPQETGCHKPVRGAEFGIRKQTGVKVFSWCPLAQVPSRGNDVPSDCFHSQGRKLLGRRGTQ